MLEQRLVELPSDLSKLYADMWHRLNDDVAIYQGGATLLFNLALKPLPVADETDDMLLKCRRRTWLQVLFAHENVDIPNLLNDQSWTEPDTFRARFQQSQRLVSVRCVDLLDTRAGSGSTPGAYDPYDGPLGDCRFVHRTAREFFISSPEGKTIMTEDRTTRGERRHRLLVANLGVAVAQ